MKKNHTGRFIAFLIVYAVLTFPLAGLAAICGDINMAGVSSSNYPSYASTSNCANNSLNINTCGWRTSQNFFMTPDSSSSPSASPLHIYENGVDIGIPHSQIVDVFNLGGGRFSHWGVNGNSELSFSTPDNTDPRTNGRSYQYGGVCMPTFTITKVADVLTGYGTFQSHNQKIVQNAYGLFMTYLYSRDATSNGTWRLARSQDGGKTWGTIWRGTLPGVAPILETDARGSIFLIASDETTSSAADATFYRFDPEKSFTNPLMKTITNGSASKSTSYWDEARQRLYYQTWGFWGEPPLPDFYALDRDGKVISFRALTHRNTDGVSFAHYPHLEMDGSRLYSAWTTSPSTVAQQRPDYRYRAIFYIYSEDGGETWKAPGGSGTLALPIYGDETGPAQMVNERDTACFDQPTTVNCYSNWLWNFVSKGGFLHFAYLHESSPSTEHYMRFSPATGFRDINAPGFQGQHITTLGYSGFFATDPLASTPLFITTSVSGGDRLAILSSSDLGQSWNDVAISDIQAPANYAWYAISGNRRLTKTGDMIGHVTTTQYPSVTDPKPAVHFFRLPAVDHSTDPNAQWTFVTLDTTKATPDGGYGFTLPMTGVEFGSDTLQNFNYSKLRLFENGLERGPAHSSHADIRSSGAGRFSHWTSNTLYFSASDNSDPRTNGKTYQVAFPSTEARGLVFYGKINSNAIVLDQGYAYAAAQFLGTDGDSINNPSGSRLIVYEDGAPIGPAHTPITTVRAAGNGAYLHWGNTLYFSASDNTDPRSNGRSYTFAVEGGTAPAVGEDLSITVSDSPDPVLINDYVTYTITITNNGPAVAHGVTVTDNLGGATFAPVGSSTNCSGAGPVNCVVGDLANGASTTLIIVAKPSTAGTLTNSVSTAETNLFDPNPTNNTATASTTVLPSCSAGNYRISGAVRKGSSNGPRIGGVTLKLSGPSCGQFITTNTQNDYAFSSLKKGSYTLTPSKTGCTFTPASRSVSISNSNVSGWSRTGFAGSGASCN